MTLLRAVFAAVLVAGVTLVACGGGEDSPSGEIRALERSFDSFAAYLEAKNTPRADDRSEDYAVAPSHQVVIIGIDGATWRFIDELIEDGQLPTFARLKKEGSYGILRSTPCYVTPPAWTAMFTGYSPEKTGVYTFGKWDASAKEFRSVTATDVRVPSSWDVASFAGKKVAVTNVPLTYPVRPVNGIMVSGLMTPLLYFNPMRLEITGYAASGELVPTATEIRSFSKPLMSEASDSLNTLVWWEIDATNDQQRNYDRLLLEVMPRPGVDVPDSSHQVFAFDIGEFSPWFKIAVDWEGVIRDGWCKFKLSRQPDGTSLVIASQILLDPRVLVNQYTHPPELADELSSRFAYYLPSKFLKREFVPEVTAESAKYASFFYDYDDWDLFYYVFTQTDNIQHLTGFSELTAEVYRTIDRFVGELMARLPEESTLIIASDHGFKKYIWGIDLNEFYEQIGLLVRKPGSEDIDFDRTMVFQNLWYLYFNREVITRENLEAAGISVEAGEEPVEAMVRYMESRGVATRNPDRQYPIEYFPLVADRYVGDGPDMLVEGGYDDYMVEYWNLKRPRGQLVFQLMPTEQYHHELDGVFIVWGRHVRSGYDAGAWDIEDITPTLLYLLGLPSAADMDGRVIFDVFHESYVKTHESYVVKDYGEFPRGAVAQEELGEPLEKKLRSLGYVK